MSLATGRTGTGLAAWVGRISPAAGSSSNVADGNRYTVPVRHGRRANAGALIEK
ncbi:hypothetical protein [Amycolatopsis speibonae]|uniref:Uncharacterized protein n=1 Tax=Amycolatopsis speibonae TaxID=1450224 RepID=A0ABV7PFC3_9PSEU